MRSARQDGVPEEEPTLTKPAPPRVLVVDDDPMIRETLADVLALEGYAGTTARDGAQGLAAVAADRPAVVLLDLMMPRLDGWGFLAECRRRGLCEGAAIVVISALHALGGEAARLRELG